MEVWIATTRCHPWPCCCANLLRLHLSPILLLCQLLQDHPLPGSLSALIPRRLVLVPVVMGVPQEPVPRSVIGRRHLRRRHPFAQSASPVPVGHVQVPAHLDHLLSRKVPRTTVAERRARKPRSPRNDSFVLLTFFLLCRFFNLF